jgi:hypothetical protein
MDTDFALANFGSVVILTPISVAAENWVGENVQTDQRWGKGIVVETGCIGNIIDALIEDGLTIS